MLMVGGWQSRAPTSWTGSHDTGITMASPVSGELGCGWGMHVSALIEETSRVVLASSGSGGHQVPGINVTSWYCRCASANLNLTSGAQTELRVAVLA